MMEINLENKSLTDLSFDATTASPEEAAAAAGVRVLRAGHNLIASVAGVGAVFTNLVELHLSHNSLGGATHARPPTREGSEPLLTLLPWLADLPPTLEVLDLSYNHLSGFWRRAATPGAALTAGQRTRQVPAAAEPSPSSLFPLALCCVFPSERLPALRRLDLSHNALACSLRDSDAAEARWAEYRGGDGASTALVELNLSHNPALSSLNALLLGAHPALADVDLRGCAIDDLAGVSSLPAAAPGCAQVRLQETPLWRSVVSAAPATTAVLLETLLGQVLGGGGADGAACADGDARAMRSALHAVAHDRLGEIDRHLRAAVTRAGGAVPAGEDGHLAVLSRTLFDALLSRVVPSLAAATAAQDLLVDAARTALAHHLGDSGGPPAPAADSRLHRTTSLSSIASGVSEELRVRPVVAEAPDDDSEPATADWYAPASLTGDERAEYDALCAEASRLQQQLLRSQKRQREYEAAAEQLRRRLADDRGVISAQKQALVELRACRDALARATAEQRETFEKRKREVSYGIHAVRSKEAAARQRAQEEAEAEAARRAQGKRKAAASSLRHGGSGSVRLSVNYGQAPTAPPPRLTRSALLREAATRRQQEEAAARDELRYSPSRPPRRTAGTSPSVAREPAEADDWGAAYGSDDRTRLAAARTYCAESLSPDQRRQLATAAAAAGAASHEPASASSGGGGDSSRDGSDSHSDGEVAAAAGVAAVAGDEAPLPEPSTDLSTLSITELFEAAAAIRRKQLALQRQDAHAGEVPTQRVLFE